MVLGGRITEKDLLGEADSSEAKLTTPYTHRHHLKMEIVCV
jgi:hypothetical protein